MTSSSQEFKAFNIRIPREIWAFIKKSSVDKNVSMQQIIVKCLRKYKIKEEKVLTGSDTKV